MKIEVVRYEFYEDRTLGILYLDGVEFCKTLEDRVRPDGIKIYGKTAIPEGTYGLTMEPFRGDAQKIYPHLHNVPNFTGICLHGGNIPEDTVGCILVGFIKNDSDHTIHNAAIASLCQRIGKATSPWQITVRNGG